jgi:gas vesicle protein
MKMAQPSPRGTPRARLLGERTKCVGGFRMRLFNRWRGANEARKRAEEARKEAGRRLDRAAAGLRGEEPAAGRPFGALVIGALGGGLAAFLLDPQRGKARRARVRDQSAAVLRRVGRQTERVGRLVGSRVSGAQQALSNRETDTLPPNDATLAEKVESELFRDPSIPKGSININAENGVVVIRGEVASESEVSRIESAVRRIPGVWEVRNLLHLPKEPAPTARSSKRG